MNNSINGYSVNPNLAISPQTYQKPAVQQGATPVAGNPSYKGDGYSFDLSNVPTGKVPDVKVGFWDKFSAVSSDVMNTPKNLQLFKDFQANTFLQAGSSNSQGVTDLQRKLKFLGFNVNINGNFGPATEKAVLNFKNSMGIDDGFLNKRGESSVTSIVSRSTMSLINSKVASKLNNPGQVEVPTISQKDLGWAKDLKSKIVNEQYKPSAEERKRYDEIYQKQQMIVSANNGSYQVGSLPGPTSSEVQWAKDFIVKVKQYGQKPSQDDIQKYNDIQRRQQMAKAAPQVPQQPAQQAVLQGVPQMQAPAPVEASVSDSQLNWAKEFEQKVNTQNYKPTQGEFKMYVEIYNKVNGTNVTTASLQGGATQPQNTGAVSQQDFQWAKNLEKAVAGGYKVKPEENNAYNAILARWQQFGVQGQQPAQQPVGATNPPTQQEITWALDLEKKITQEKYSPTQQDVAKYNDIAARISQVVPPVQDSAPVSPVQTVIPQQKPEPRIQIQNNTATQPFSYNDDKINAFTSAFGGVEFQTTSKSIPFLPPDAASQVAQKYGFESIEQLQSAIGAKVDGKFGPETYFRLQNALTRTPVQQSQPDQSQQVSAPEQTQDVQQPVSTQAPSAQELDWASKFADAVKNNYKYSPEELAQYKDIFSRYQASNGEQQQVAQPQAAQVTTQPIGNALAGQPTSRINAGSGDPDLNWALQLLDAVKQGYVPTEEENQKYEQVIAKNQASG